MLDEPVTHAKAALLSASPALQKLKAFGDFLGDKFGWPEWYSSSTDIKADVHRSLSRPLLPQEAIRAARLVNSYECGLSCSLPSSNDRESIIAFLVWLVHQGAVGHVIVVPKAAVESWQDAFASLIRSHRIQLTVCDETKPPAQRKELIRATLTEAWLNKSSDCVLLTTYSIVTRHIPDLKRARSIRTMTFVDGYSNMPQAYVKGSTFYKIAVSLRQDSGASCIFANDMPARGDSLRFRNRQLLDAFSDRTTLVVFESAAQEAHTLQQAATALTSGSAPAAHPRWTEPSVALPFVEMALAQLYQELLCRCRFLEESAGVAAAEASSSSAAAGPSGSAAGSSTA